MTVGKVGHLCLNGRLLSSEQQASVPFSSKLLSSLDRRHLANLNSNRLAQQLIFLTGQETKAHDTGSWNSLVSEDTGPVKFSTALHARFMLCNREPEPHRVAPSSDGFNAYVNPSANKGEVATLASACT